MIEIKARSCYNLYIDAYLPYILERLVGKIGVYIITRSSNGRTAGFGPVNRGSSPCRVAIVIVRRAYEFKYTSKKYIW